jgi:hypothetical protein
MRFEKRIFYISPIKSTEGESKQTKVKILQTE